MRKTNLLATSNGSLLNQPMKRAAFMNAARVFLAFFLIGTMATATTAQSNAKLSKWAGGMAGEKYAAGPQANESRNQTVERSAAGDVTTTANGKNDVIGSWIVDVTAGGGVSFKALLTFTSDGGLLESETGAFSSRAHGTWERAGGHTFAFRFIALLSSDLDGTFAGTVSVSSTIRISGDEYIDPGFTVKVFDPHGNQVFSGGGTAHGTRILVEP
ncbi:MAG TPA: hypothetical protein VN687_17875 [Blastocatellia bacterium]|nr:hypothetical protein [Blastocatellia bacterium]